MERYLSDSVCERLDRIAKEEANRYRSAEPFPHIMIDDFFPETLLLRALESFPGDRDVDWWRFDGEYEKKAGFHHVERMPPDLREIFYVLSGPTFLKFLESLTGIESLLPDPYFYGGGLHRIERGGFLEVHADFNRLKELNLDRQLNLLLYLNRDWKEEYGGHLELWDRDATRCLKKISPIFNRCVIFTTGDTSFHGHPQPLTCPEGMSRKSIATYYYTAGSAAESRPPDRSTVFRERPAEQPESIPERAPRLGDAVRPYVPPILLDAYRRIRRRRS